MNFLGGFGLIIIGFLAAFGVLFLTLALIALAAWVGKL